MVHERGKPTNIHQKRHKQRAQEEEPERNLEKNQRAQIWHTNKCKPRIIKLLANCKKTWEEAMEDT